MSRQEEFRRYVELSAVSQGAIVARHVALKVSAEAGRQAEIAKPIIQEASRKAWAEIQRQTTAAKPIVQDVTKRAVVSTLKTSQQAGRLIRVVAVQGVEHAIPLMRQLNQQFTLAGKASLVCVAGLFGVIMLAGAGSGWFFGGVSSSAVTAEISPNPPDIEGEVQAAVEPPAEEQMAKETNNVAQTEQTDVFEQWRHQPPPTTAEYDGSLQQGNVQAAPRQIGYTPQQMGRFAAAGYRPHLQPQRYPR